MLDTNKDTTGKLPATSMDNLSLNLRHGRFTSHLSRPTNFSGPFWSDQFQIIPCLSLPCLETVARSNSEPDENTTRALALILPDTKFE